MKTFGKVFRAFSIGVMFFIIIVFLLSVLSGIASAQTVAEDQPSLVSQVFKDPTTYAPAAVAGYGMWRDWYTSQHPFHHGAWELNPKFTICGCDSERGDPRMPGGRPVSYARGNLTIAGSTLWAFGTSVGSNAASRVTERLLLKAGANRKVVTVLGWTARIAVGTGIAYYYSAANYKQLSKTRAWEQWYHDAGQPQLVDGYPQWATPESGFTPHP